ncbi:uncharacterized protein LOC117929552 [Vitis riparia]|uniref:uncharacterized protein LOC117929552 n=1 Tax=Vitis riparia TaxID=96939 RepID=UPI00155A5CFA|nr:uncharacterized protein LOC117929552 [Vitis riparia]
MAFDACDFSALSPTMGCSGIELLEADAFDLRCFQSLTCVSRIINGSDMSATFYTHDMRHTRSLTLAKLHSGVNLVFQKKATASPPLPILTDQACKPHTRKPPLVVPRGM